MLRFVRSVAKLTSGRTRPRMAEGFLIDPARFELAATAERMRVDRNGSVVSMLIVEPSATKQSPSEIQDLERQLAARLRLTDTAGWLRDGRIGILLPDTPASGAWKVAADLCEWYDVGVDRPNCEVVAYPVSSGSGGDGPDGDDFGEDWPDAGPRQSVEQPATGAPETPKPTTVGGLHHSQARVMESQRAGCPGFQFDEHLGRPYPTWKRAIDLAGSAIGLALAGPVIAAAAAAIRLTTSGPAFFTQEREGQGGRRFRIYKLCTMRPDAERLKAHLREHSEQDGPAFKMEHDPRITPIGRFLRRTSIDELPQLLNVLRGEMSLVGPRPLPIDESLACEPWQRRRLQVRPGLTCTWQIYGRNLVPFDEWIRMDLDYAERQSPWLDLKLVAQTGPTLLLQRGR